MSEKEIYTALGALTKDKAAWKENFDHYIRPQDDFVAYENQEIEKDANYFATTVMRDGINNSNYA